MTLTIGISLMDQATSEAPQSSRNRMYFLTCRNLFIFMSHSQTFNYSDQKTRNYLVAKLDNKLWTCIMKVHR